MKKKIISIVIVIILIAVAVGVFTFKGKKVEIKIGNEENNSQKKVNDKQIPSEENKNESTEISDSGKSAGAKTTDSTNNTNVKDSVATAENNLKIIQRLVDFGFQKSSERNIDTIIIHSTYDALNKDPYNVTGVIAEYKMYNVSPHYLIDREGNIYRLVSDKDIAFHAGVSKTPDGRANVNGFSIGIEIIETKSDSPSPAQYDSLKKLLTQLKSEYKIKYVLGHKDIAPGRKDDPWNFDWNKL